MLKLQRNFGQWVELRDAGNGRVVTLRVVQTAEPGKVQIEFEAPEQVKINRVTAPDANGRGVRRA